MDDQTLKAILGENPEDSDGSVKGFLERRKAVLFPCSDGLEVIRAAYSKGPDIIILDTGLPRMNGYQCSRVLKQDPVTGDVPIVHLGRSATPLERYWSKVCRADAYLPLPLQDNDLDAVIRGLLGRAGPRRRLLPPVSITPALEDRDILALATHLLEHDLLISSVLNEINRLDAWSLSSRDMVASLLAIIHSLFPFSCGAGLLIFEKHSELYLRPAKDTICNEPERMQLLIRDHLRDRHGRYLDPKDITLVLLPPHSEGASGRKAGDVFLHTRPGAPVRSVLAFEDLNPESLRREDREVLRTALEMAHGIMEKRVFATTAQEMSVIDETTSGYSMAFFMEVLTRELLNARRNRYPVTLFTLVISNFQDLMNALAEEERSSFLKSIHGAILRTMRKTDIVARRGHAEFVFLLTHTTRDHAAVPAQRVKTHILEDVSAGSPGLGPLKVSMGVSQFDPDRHSTPESFLNDAMPRRSPGLNGERVPAGRVLAGGDQ